MKKISKTATPVSIKKLRQSIKSQNPKAIVSITSAKSPIQEMFEIQIPKNKTVDIGVVYKIIYNKRVATVLVATNPGIEKIMKGKSDKHIRIRLSKNSFTEIKL